MQGGEDERLVGHSWASRMEERARLHPPLSPPIRRATSPAHPTHSPQLAPTGSRKLRAPPHPTHTPPLPLAVFVASDRATWFAINESRETHKNGAHNWYRQKGGLTQ